MPATIAQLLTAEQFAALPEPGDASQQELVKGEVVTMPPPKGRHGILCSHLNGLLWVFVSARHLGWVTCNDAGVILGRDPDTVLGPDVAFYSIARQPMWPEDYFEIAPDLVVEVLSPFDRRAAVRAKVHTYITAGVKLVWLVDPETRTVMVYAGTLRGVEYGDADSLEGGDVLPGFTARIADIFA